MSAVFGSLTAKGFSGGSWENRRLSASRPAMSSQELMTSGSDRSGLGSDQRDLGSENELGKMEPRVKRVAGVGGVVGLGECGGGSRARTPYVEEVSETMW